MTPSRSASSGESTGRPGPATWEVGSYPEGQDEHPVSGVSWYEAAAYAEYVGMSLPTRFHWLMGMGYFTPMIRFRSCDACLPGRQFGE